MNAETFEEIIAQRDEALLEVERLKQHILREAKSKTVSVELPCKENGGRFYVTAPWSTSEETLAQNMRGSIELMAAAMKAFEK